MASVLVLMMMLVYVDLPALWWRLCRRVKRKVERNAHPAEQNERISGVQSPSSDSELYSLSIIFWRKLMLLRFLPNNSAVAFFLSKDL